MNRLRFYIAVLSVSAMLGMDAREIYNDPSVTVAPGVIASDTLPSLFNDLDYHLRLEIPRNCADAVWTVRLEYSDMTATVVSVTREGMSTDDWLYGAPLSVKVDRFGPDGNFDSAADYEITKDIDPTIDAWSFTITLNPGDTQATCAIGQRSPLLTFPLDITGLRSVTTATGSKLKLARLSMFVSECDSLSSSLISSFEQLQETLAGSTDPAEGVWRYLDRDTDLRRINLGENYVLATVCAPDGSVEILYLGNTGGTSSAGQRWQPLMLKGRLKPTVFINHYDLEWYDAFGSKIIYETSADIIDGAILKINFPVHGGSVRFQKAKSAVCLSR